MSRTLAIIWVSLLSATTAFADAPHNEVLRRTGGLVSREGSGRLLVVNHQRQVPEKMIREKVEYISRLLGIRADISAEEAPATVTIVLAEGKTPVRRRGYGGMNTEMFKSDRLRQDFDAAFARMAADLFVPPGIETKSTRDEIEAVFRGDSFTVAAAGELKRLLPKVGFLPAMVATYRTACREGWAPPPSNDVQRVIWAHALSEKERGPTNPILILPPKKK